MSETDKLKIEMYDDVVKEKNKEYIELSCRFRETCNDIKNKDKEIERLHSIIKEVREYITSYESIETIQQFDHNKNNKDLDYSTIDEMTRRYMIVHDKVLKILDKADKENK